MLLSHILEDVGSSGFGALAIIKTKSQDITTSAALILNILLKMCFLGAPRFQTFHCCIFGEPL